MRHPSKSLLDRAIAYRAGAIGLGLLPIAMAFAAVLIPWSVTSGPCRMRSRRRAPSPEQALAECPPSWTAIRTTNMAERSLLRPASFAG